MKFHLEVADPVQPIGGEGSQDNQQTETDEDSEPDLVLACAIADPYFLDEAPQSNTSKLFVDLSLVVRYLRLETVDLIH